MLIITVYKVILSLSEQTITGTTALNMGKKFIGIEKDPNMIMIKNFFIKSYHQSFSSVH
jgi:hypothetical protein